MMRSSNGNIFRVTGHLCGEFTGPRRIPAQRPVTRRFDISFDLRLNKRFSKQSWGWWFETVSHPLWRHRNAMKLGADINLPNCGHVVKTWITENETWNENELNYRFQTDRIKSSRFTSNTCWKSIKKCCNFWPNVALRWLMTVSNWSFPTIIWKTNHSLPLTLGIYIVLGSLKK